MSEKDFDVNASGFDSEVINPVLFGYFDFIGDPMWLHTSVGKLTWGNADWMGLGNFVSVEPIKESLELRPGRFRLSLAVGDTKMMSWVTDEQTVGRRCEIFLGALDADGALIDAPNIMIIGTMGSPEVVVGENNAVSMVVEDIRADFSRINGLRFALEDHQEEAPGDFFAEFVPQMIDHRFVFNGQSHGGRGINSQRPRDAFDFDFNNFTLDYMRG